MSSPILDTFKDAKYVLLSVVIMVGYGITLLSFDSFLFFAPYFTFYLPASAYANLLLDLLLTFLTAIMLTVSIRQISLQRQSGSASKTGVLGLGTIAAVLAGACPCYLVPLLAVAGGIGGALLAVGIMLNALQIPIKLGAMLILVVAAYKLNKSGVCRIRPRPQSVASEQNLNLH